jgi:hypothetical protein
VSGRKSFSNHNHLPDQRLGRMLEDRDRQFESHRGKLSKIGSIALVLILGGGAALFFSSSENREAVVDLIKAVKEAEAPPTPTAAAPAPAPGATPAPSELKPNGLIAPEDARFVKEIFQFIQAPDHQK